MEHQKRPQSSEFPDHWLRRLRAHEDPRQASPQRWPRSAARQRFATFGDIFKVTKMISFHPHLSTSDASDCLQYTPVSFPTKEHGRRPTLWQNSLKPRKRQTKSRPRDEGHLGGADRSQPEPQSSRSPQRGTIERARIHVDIRKQTSRSSLQRMPSTSQSPTDKTSPGMRINAWGLSSIVKASSATRLGSIKTRPSMGDEV